MLEGWQGWWTGGRYNSNLNRFQWKNAQFIDQHWGFQKTPYEDT